MASELDHINLANRNHSMLMFLLDEGNRYPEWTVTVAFYKAVHVVEAVFANDRQRHSSSHKDREESLKTSSYKNIWKPYAHLLNASKIARYLEDTSTSSGAYRTFADYLTADQVKDRHVKKKLFTVEQQSIQFLSGAAKGGLVKIDPSQMA